MSYSILAIIIVVLLLLITAFINVFSWVKKYFYATKFQTYVAILNYHMEKAYEMVHKDKILIFSLEAVRPSEKDVDAAAKEFCKLTIKFLGPMLYQELKNVYGTHDALLFTMIEYFSSQYESDEIRNASVESLAAKQNEVEET